MHNGELKPEDLHTGLIAKTYTELEKGAAEGYGKSWLKVDTEIATTVAKLQENLYFFSAAKTYQQLEEMNSFLVDEKGKIRSYSQFKRKVDAVHKNYNRNYLQTEFRTSKRSAQSARQWSEFEANKDLFPNLMYITVGDDKVRPDHVKLNGIIKPINHPFWDTHYPPNGWNDRCSVKPTASNVTSEKIDVEPDKGFSFNVGKTKQLFNEKDHPYFTMPKTAKKNVNKSVEEFKKAQQIKKDGKNK